MRSYLHPKRTEQGYVELECGCTYADASTVVSACERHRYMTCARCGSTRAQISPFGLLCPNCSFPRGVPDADNALELTSDMP